MKCKHFTIRSKQYKKYYYCRLNKKEINYSECYNCKNKILKTIKTIRNKGKKINVFRETYDKVYERDNGLCRLCGSNNIQLHHILYRSERKDLINEPSNCIMLCVKCHRLVHSNKKKWQSYLINLIKERNFKNER